ncbi:hypothetical protein B0H14DRAFT_2569286 [Mycena olivaceomarginata]|nr:hypothetical protein B0H14DRAFT_2569286 [Mycena olivaceomarginata]
MEGPLARAEVLVGGDVNHRKGSLDGGVRDVVLVNINIEGTKARTEWGGRGCERFNHRKGSLDGGARREPSGAGVDAKGGSAGKGVRVAVPEAGVIARDGNKIVPNLLCCLQCILGLGIADSVAVPLGLKVGVERIAIRRQLEAPLQRSGGLSTHKLIIEHLGVASEYWFGGNGRWESIHKVRGDFAKFQPEARRIAAEDFIQFVWYEELERLAQKSAVAYVGVKIGVIDWSKETTRLLPVGGISSLASKSRHISMRQQWTDTLNSFKKEAEKFCKKCNSFLHFRIGWAGGKSKVLQVVSQALPMYAEDDAFLKIRIVKWR